MDEEDVAKYENRYLRALDEATERMMKRAMKAFWEACQCEQCRIMRVVERPFG